MQNAHHVPRQAYPATAFLIKRERLDPEEPKYLNRLPLFLALFFFCHFQPKNRMSSLKTT